MSSKNDIDIRRGLETAFRKAKSMPVRLNALKLVLVSDGSPIASAVAALPVVVHQHDLIAIQLRMAARVKRRNNRPWVRRRVLGA